MASKLFCLLSIIAQFLLTFTVLFSAGNSPNLPWDTDGEDEEIHMRVGTDRYFTTDSLYFELTDPDEISYVYKIMPAKDFGSALDHTMLDVELVPAEPSDSCNNLINVREIRGNIALVERGQCSFLSKALIAESAGAIAIVITDNDPSNDDKLIEMLSDGTPRATRIPAFFLLGKDGHMIRQSLQQLHRSSALINIPINATGLADLPRQLPPWTLW